MDLSKRIGIITLFGYFNYGNRLQNYALEQAIKEFGFEVATVVVQKKAEVRKLKWKKKVLNWEQKFVNWEQKNSKYLPKSIKNISEKINIHIEKKTRDQCNEKFSNKFLNEKFYNYSEKELKKANNEYDYFVTGSDQVWNPYYIKKMGSVYFLAFADKKKRISYAPSFGVDSIPDEYEEDYKNWLLNMEKLSVRELVGKEIIRNLTGKDAEILIDPTLLITKKKWLEISSEADNKPTEKFLLTYFLGNVDSKTKMQIDNIAQKKDLKIVNLADKNDKENYKNGPGEFIDYINSAEVIFTDSFHGTVFSILMKKPFVICKKNGSSATYSRIETLLDMFCLKSREFENIKNDNQIFNADFSHVDKILDLKRKKANSYLSKAFQVES